MEYSIFDLHDALLNFVDSDLFTASIRLFEVMGYPVTACGGKANEDAQTFIYLYTENRVLLSSDEAGVLTSVQGISHLFTINDHSEGAGDIKPFVHEQVRVYSIVFLAVDLSGSMEERSQGACHITKILSKCYSCPILVIFRHCDSILFAGRLEPELGGESSDTYLSRWNSVFEPDVHIMNKLSELFFDNHSGIDFLEIYYDILHALAREYHIYTESIELLANGLYLDEYSALVYEPGQDSLILRREMIPVAECIQAKREYYQELYGSDYILEDFKTDARGKFDIDEFFPLENEVPDTGDDAVDGFEHTPGRAQLNLDLYFTDDEYDDMDESYFDDPIRLLEFIDKKY